MDWRDAVQAGAVFLGAMAGSALGRVLVDRAHRRRAHRAAQRLNERDAAAMARELAWRDRVSEPRWMRPRDEREG